jgi:hypothetical protein
MNTINIYQDNKVIKSFENVDSDFCAFQWLLNHQGQSTDYAIRYGGYKVEIIDNVTGEKDYWKPYEPIHK